MKNAAIMFLQKPKFNDIAKKDYIFTLYLLCWHTTL